MDDSFFEQLMDFIKAREEAQKSGRHEFICPICGGNAVWDRHPHNNHLNCKCHGCGIRIME